MHAIVASVIATIQVKSKDEAQQLGLKEEKAHLEDTINKLKK